MESMARGSGGGSGGSGRARDAQQPQQPQQPQQQRGMSPDTSARFQALLTRMSDVSDRFDRNVMRPELPSPSPSRAGNSLDNAGSPDNSLGSLGSAHPPPLARLRSLGSAGNNSVHRLARMDSLGSSGEREREGHDAHDQPRTRR
jgi:hypothetical protein